MQLRAMKLTTSGTGNFVVRTLCKRYFNPSSLRGAKTARTPLSSSLSSSSSSLVNRRLLSNATAIGSIDSKINNSKKFTSYDVSLSSNTHTNRNTNVNLCTIRFKSSLHKKAVQALSKQKQHFKKSKNDGATNKTNAVNGMKDTNGESLIIDENDDNSVLSFMEKDEVQELTKDDEINMSGKELDEAVISDENELKSKIEEEPMMAPEPPVAAPAPAPAAPLQQQHFQLHEFAPRIVVVGVGGGGGNAVNNMIANQLNGVDFLALNTDAQHLSTILTDNRIQIGSTLTSGLGCGANPDAGRLAAEESKEQITELLSDAHMVFITAGMGGGTGTGAAPVVAEICYNLGILTVGVITKPFRFEGTHRMRLAREGIERMEQVVDTLIVIPNQNLFAMANDQTSFMDAFAMADNVLLAGVKSITDLMTTPGLINLDFADVQSVMHGMGNAILGTGQSNSQLTTDAEGNMPERAILAAEQALANPLLGDNMDIGTAKGMLVNITGGKDMTLFEVDRAAQCITERIQDESANIIFGSAYDESLDGSIRVSVVATGIEEYKTEK